MPCSTVDFEFSARIVPDLYILTASPSGRIYPRLPVQGSSSLRFVLYACGDPQMATTMRVTHYLDKPSTTLIKKVYIVVRVAI